MKKLFAILMTMAMVMGLGITGFAATKDTATITVNNADGAQLTYLQIIEPDQESETGWKFINGAGTYFVSAFSVEDEQAAIRALTGSTVDANDLAEALEGVANNLGYTPMDNPQTVTTAGLYAIKATQTGYTYGNMAAYVGFGDVEGTFDYPSLEDARLDAKGTPSSVSKSVKEDATNESDKNKVVQIGDIVTYTIEANVPYFDPSAENKTFRIFDDIDGATYYLKEDDSVATVTVGNVPFNEAVFDTSGTYGHDLVIDLSTYINNTNSNAGKKVVVTYTAKITEVDANNKAGSNIGGTETSQDDKPSIDLYTGEITLTKWNKDETVKLAGAEFTVKLNGTNDALTFSTAKDEAGMNVYTYDPNGSVTTLITGTAGTLKVEGLDVGIYSFEETKAPKGYSKLAAPFTVELKLADGTTSATAIVKAEKDVYNDTLIGLPETGGMGTTLFTIAGCVIMISAAGLFFATRKKAN